MFLAINKGQLVSYIGDEPFTDSNYYETLDYQKLYRVVTDDNIGYDCSLMEMEGNLYFCFLDGETPTSASYAGLKASENVVFYFEKSGE